MLELQENFQRVLRGRCQQVVDSLKLVHGNDFQAAFRNYQPVNRHVACDENFAMTRAAGCGMIGTEVAHDQLKSLRRQIQTNLFVNFTDNSLQEALVAFAATAEKADLPRI